MVLKRACDERAHYTSTGSPRRRLRALPLDPASAGASLVSVTHRLPPSAASIGVSPASTTQSSRPNTVDDVMRLLPPLPWACFVRTLRRPCSAIPTSQRAIMISDLKLIRSNQFQLGERDAMVFGVMKQEPSET